MTEPLFREEFLKARARADFGEVMLPPQRAVRLAAAGSLAVVAALIGVLACLPYTRVETSPGFVVSDSQAVAVASALKQPVRVEAVLARGGQPTAPGDPLLLVGLDGPADASDPAQSKAPVADTTGGGVAPRPGFATIFSERHGRIDKFLVSPGARLVPGQPIALLRRDRGRIAVQALADSRSIGFLRPGREVFVRVDGFSYQRYGTLRGRIAAVSDSALSPSQATALFHIPPSSQARFVVDIAIDDARSIGGVQTLRPGMNALVDFPVERMSMLRWVFGALLRTGGRDGR